MNREKVDKTQHKAYLNGIQCFIINAMIVVKRIRSEYGYCTIGLKMDLCVDNMSIHIKSMTSQLTIFVLE